MTLSLYSSVARSRYAFSASTTLRYSQSRLVTTTRTGAFTTMTSQPPATPSRKEICMRCGSIGHSSQHCLVSHLAMIKADKQAVLDRSIKDIPCFWCGSFSHTLSVCPSPYDMAPHRFEVMKDLLGKEEGEPVAQYENSVASNKNGEAASRPFRQPEKTVSSREVEVEKEKEKVKEKVKIRSSSFSPLFLRDACTCSKCVDPSSKQKKFRTTDIPDDIKVLSLIEQHNGDVQIRWKNDIPGLGDHMSTFSKLFLTTVSRAGRQILSRFDNFKYYSWDANTISKHLQFVNYESYMATEETLYRALEMLQRYGLLLVRGVPKSETAVEEIANRIGNLRDSLYGRTWDVRPIPEAKNVAYTSQHLGLHMDLLYMRDPPGLQFLHCLENSCEGGASLFSDSFQAIFNLPWKIEDKLKKFNISYHYRNAGEHYHCQHPVIETRHRYLRAVNYSPPFQDNFPIGDDLGPGIEALRQLANQLESPENLFEYKLQEGECVIFANRRVVHGRKEFDTSTGKRWLKGAYIDTDVFRSRYRVMKEKFYYVDKSFLTQHSQYVGKNQPEPISEVAAGPEA